MTDCLSAGYISSLCYFPLASLPFLENLVLTLSVAFQHSFLKLSYYYFSGDIDLLIYFPTKEVVFETQIAKITCHISIQFSASKCY
jgi:hypothetical protein